MRAGMVEALFWQLEQLIDKSGTERICLYPNASQSGVNAKLVLRDINWSSNVVDSRRVGREGTNFLARSSNSTFDCILAELCPPNNLNPQTPLLSSPPMTIGSPS
jgi:enhancing lycopene biosynthesis protein 2